MKAEDILKVSPIIPVITIDNADDAVDLAIALAKGGINVMEITLRTDCAIKAIENVAKNLPNMVVGAGTVLNCEQFDAVCEAGAKFVISPGFTTKLLEHASKQNIPLIPGVGTASEIMTAIEFGFDTFKLFPANIVGGVGALKAFSGPFKNINFCPTGGVNLQNMNEFLSVENVLCVGGTWLTPKEDINAHRFNNITNYCKEALEKLER
jgi:2-dehydro-3-deoxyphosphogluconate aldolase/(4S)-4-hydroxy-2-oxoglutarate aldolase